MGGRRRGCFFNWIRSDIPYFASEDSSSSVVLLSVRSIPPTEQPPPRHDSSSTDTNEPQRRLLSQINDRFRRTLSLEDPQEASYQQYGRENRPKSMVQNTNVVRANNQNATLTLNPTTKPSPKKKRFKSKFFFSLENFLHSRQSVATSDDLSSSKYCKFELESAESSPLFKGRNTPDLLDVPGISNEQLRCKKRLDKLENHFNKIQQLKDERLPLDNRDRTVYEDIVYSESLYSSKSTLVIGNAEEQFENSKCLDRYDDLDVKEPRAVGFVENNADVAYVINIEENDVLINDRTKELVVKIMDKSVDSIGSCSLDVDADNTDFSDTTSGSLNILTPSSAGSHIRDFTSRLQERAGPGFLKQDLQTLNEEQQDCRKKPSYLHLACSVNGYNNITTYDSKLRQKLNKSREASPGRIGNTTDMLRDCTDDAMASRLNSNSIFKTSFSESSISSQNVVTVTKTNGTQKNVFETHASRSYHLISNGGAESPTKSFIQQRVERLYGPGALAQGFFNQKRVKTISQCEEEKNALNGGKIVNYMKSPEGIHQVSRTHYLNRSPNGVASESVMTESLTNGENCDPALPVLRHLRPEFRAQLPILSPKRSVPFRNADNDFNISSDHETSQNNLSNPRLTSADVVDRASPAKVEQIKTHHVNVVKSVPHVTIVPIERELDVCKLVPSVNGTVKLNTEFSKLDVKTEEVKSDACKVNGVKKETVVAVAKESLDDNCNRVSEAVSDAVQVKDVPADGQDGHYFLELKRAETERLIRLAETAERDLEELLQCGDTSEEVLGFLRAAAGKARLLATQKMQQFEGLCHNNLNRRADEPFPTTNSDLRGFWDMVSLQLTHVALIFSQLEAMRAGGWKEVPAESKPADAPKPKQTRPKKIPAAAKPSIDPARAKKREEQRKLLASVRAKKNQQEEDEVQIFAPAKSSS